MPRPTFQPMKSAPGATPVYGQNRAADVYPTANGSSIRLDRNEEYAEYVKIRQNRKLHNCACFQIIHEINSQNAQLNGKR